MNFSKEYQDLEDRVEQAFTEKRSQIVEIDFLNSTNFEDFENMYDALEGCPTSYYNGKDGGEYQVYITKIDSEGIHVIECEDNTRKKSIGLKDLNGLYYKIELLETIEKHLKIIDFIHKFGVEVKEEDNEAYVELMMDNHKCIVFDGRGYYIPRDSILFNDEDFDLVDLVIEKYQFNG
jgi:hypothetical protein